ncbi:MAG: GNAT family N-acetyltransferase [Hyphomicrobiaceae bacterium]
MDTSHELLPYGLTGHGKDAAVLASLKVERLDTATAILAAIEELGAEGETGFQTATWLSAIYRHLVPATGQPLGLAIHTESGRLLGLVPLYTYKHGHLTVAKFADCGVSDYNAVLGDTTMGNAALLALIKPACQDVDILALERMTATCPFSRHPTARPSRMSGNSLTIIDTVDDFIRSRGKKFRKEVERCFRVLNSEGQRSFQRAQTPAEISNAFAALEQQQAERHADKGSLYELGAPQYGAFYRDVLNAGPDLGHVFTLTVDGKIIAALMGIVHNGTFTLLRTANGGDAWRHVSPGRLIVIEAMRHLHALGVKTFDMGIGDYAFKRSFGTEPIPLADLVVPISWRGTPTVTTLRLKDRLRQNERLVSTVRTLKTRLGSLRS